MRTLWISIFGLIVVLGGAWGLWLYQDSQKTVLLTVAAGERGSDSFTLMSEISEVVDRHSKKIRLEVIESRNASEGISLIAGGQAQLATIENNTPAYSNIQLVADLFSDYYLLVTREEDTLSLRGLPPLRSITDLPGQSVIIPESGTTGNLSFWSAIDHYKVAPESFRTYALPLSKAMEQFIDGKADAIFFLRSLRDPFLLGFLEEAGLRNLRFKFVPIDQADAMKLKRPYLEPAKIVKGAFDGAISLPREDVVVPSLDRLLVAGRTVDPEAVFELVQVIFNNRLDLLNRMPLSSSIQDPRQEGSAALGLHEGATRYFDRDQPSFLQENAEPMALIVTVLAMMISAILALRRNLSSTAKNRADVYNDQLLDISARARTCDEMSELRAMRGELGTVMETAVRALDEDRVTEEGFQSFSMLWGSVRDTVNDRIQDIREQN